MRSHDLTEKLKAYVSLLVAVLYELHHNCLSQSIMKSGLQDVVRLRNANST